MDISKMLEELRAEREAVEEAIITLERLEQGHGKRRGRPPAWLAEVRRREAGTKEKETEPPPKHRRKQASDNT